MFPKEFVAAADLNGEEQLTIDQLVQKPVGREKEIKPVLYFRGKERGLVLNFTNANKLKDAYGDNTDAWRGQPVTLYTTTVDFQGKSVPAIRVRVDAPEAQEAQANADLGGW